jgi:N-acetyl sugar amidotransferase
MNNLKRCTRCVMPETWAGISFDEKGVCSLCRAYDEQSKIDWVSRKQELVYVLGEAQNDAERRGNKYTAICGYSGGKDTAFTIAYLTKELGHKVLAFTYDHGHPLVPEGEWNLNEFPKILGIDHLRFTLGNDLRNAICKMGMEQIKDWCLPCHRGVGAGIVNIAEALGIKLAVFGEPTALYSTTGHYQMADQEEHDRRHFENVFCGKLDAIPSGYTQEDVWILNWPEKRVSLRSIYLGNFVPWRQAENVEYIKKLGWKCPEATPDNPWPWNKLDCAFEVHRNWTKILKGLKFDSVSFRASIDIREGRMTREQALDLVQKYEGRKPEDMEAFCSDIGMTEDQFNGMICKS